MALDFLTTAASLAMLFAGQGVSSISAWLSAYAIGLELGLRGKDTR